MKILSSGRTTDKCHLKYRLEMPPFHLRQFHILLYKQHLHSPNMAGEHRMDNSRRQCRHRASHLTDNHIRLTGSSLHILRIRELIRTCRHSRLHQHRLRRPMRPGELLNYNLVHRNRL